MCGCVSHLTFFSFVSLHPCHRPCPLELQVVLNIVVVGDRAANTKKKLGQKGSYMTYLVDILTESGRKKEAVELLEGLLPGGKVWIGQDLEGLLDGQETGDGRDVVLGEDGQVLELLLGHCCLNEGWGKGGKGRNGREGEEEWREKDEREGRRGRRRGKRRREGEKKQKIKKSNYGSEMGDLKR